MSHAVEYLFASNVTIADQAARKQGWRPCGRADCRLRLIASAISYPPNSDEVF
jgi:hypothetical protein